MASFFSAIFSLLLNLLRPLINLFLYPFYLRLPEQKNSKELHVSEESIQAQVRARPSGSTLKVLRNNVSHVLPRKSSTNQHTIYVGSQNEILDVDVKAATVTVQPSVTMEQLVNRLLPLDLLPFVLPEFNNLTVGGLIAGAGLESSSFKHGQFADSILRCRYLLGDGSIIDCSPTEHSSLFYGALGAMGTMGLLLDCTLKLERLQQARWVQVQYFNVKEPTDLLNVMLQKRDLELDYLDAVYYSEEKSIICLATRVNNVDRKRVVDLSKRSAQFWYLHMANKRDGDVEYVTLEDYLFRFDRGAYWMGRYAFPNMFNYAPLRALMAPLMSTAALYSRLHAAPQTLVQSTLLVQDIYIPLSKAKEFLSLVPEFVKPIWLCPVKCTKHPQLFSPHYIQSSDEWMINFGIYWGQYTAKRDVKRLSRDLEEASMRLGGRHMLYADSYYTEEQWAKIYDVKQYRVLKSEYDKDMAWGDVRAKVVTS